MKGVFTLPLDYVLKKKIIQIRMVCLHETKINEMKQNDSFFTWLSNFKIYYLWFNRLRKRSNIGVDDVDNCPQQAVISTEGKWLTSLKFFNANKYNILKNFRMKHNLCLCIPPPILSILRVKSFPFLLAQNSNASSYSWHLTSELFLVLYITKTVVSNILSRACPYIQFVMKHRQFTTLSVWDTTSFASLA